MKKILHIIIILLVFTSCASSVKIQEKYKGWIGKSSSELIQSWGQPQKQVSADNGGLVLFFDLNTQNVPINGVNTGITGGVKVFVDANGSIIKFAPSIHL